MVETPHRRRSSRSRRTLSPSPSRKEPVVEIPIKDNITVNGHSTGSSAAPRTRSVSRSRKTNGTANGSANGHANGLANGSASKGAAYTYKKGQVVDGWRVGDSPAVDANPHFDFGGAPGVTAMMIGFPALMYYMWVGATYYDGNFPTPAPGQTWEEFGKGLVRLCYEGAFPSLKAWTIYWTFLVGQGLMYLYMPGVYATGKPLHHEGGKQLKYYCSAVYSFYATMIMAAALHWSGLFKLYTLIDEFGPLMSVAIISGFLVSIVAYVSTFARGKQHRMTGSHVYDFFMGAELNPRLFGWLDFKMFFEVRLPWYILFLLTAGTAARQWERYGYVSGEVAFLLMAHWLYANACSKGEEMIVTSWDIYYEKWGFMLIFWNLAGVPLSYCHCTIFLANHDPSEYHWSKPALVWFFASYLFAYWVWDTGNSQKNYFRSQSRGYSVDRNTFPQLPWKFVKNPQQIETQAGDPILCDGWFGIVRKPHYVADTYFAICWGLITGFKSPFPWFYPVFFCCMITHRAYRDIQRCKEKYGEAWKEYERRVPYLFIPYVF
ncbi:Delta(24(24(1)))-sterol reductase-like protein [Elsinoe fawcettii]|nr:Delta(24(24(1)))-sterol reductase-like protein [Elsinoe fawcettii]